MKPVEALHGADARGALSLSRRSNSLQAQPVGVQVQTKEQVKQDHAITILAKKIIDAHNQTAEKYRDLVMYIRAHKVSDVLVKIRMLALGFKRSRISEVIRVAYSPTNIFKPFEAKQIGFGRALEFARKDGKKTKLTEAAAIAGVSPSEAKLTLPVDSADTGKRLTYGQRMKAWAKQLAFHAKHEHKFDFKDSEYRVLVTWKNKQ